MKRIYRGRHLTPTEVSKARDIRQKIMAELPPGEAIPDDLPLYPSGVLLQVLGIANGLRAARESRGLSASQVAAKAKMNKAIVSRLESGVQDNPTLETLARYAKALDMELVVELRPIEPKTTKKRSLARGKKTAKAEKR